MVEFNKKMTQEEFAQGIAWRIHEARGQALLTFQRTKGRDVVLYLPPVGDDEWQVLLEGIRDAVQYERWAIGLLLTKMIDDAADGGHKELQAKLEELDRWIEDRGPSHMPVRLWETELMITPSEKDMEFAKVVADRVTNGRQTIEDRRNHPPEIPQGMRARWDPMETEWIVEPDPHTEREDVATPRKRKAAKRRRK